MQSPLTSSGVSNFMDDSVWKEMLRRIELELKAQDNLIERPKPFEHGKAVGNRTALRFVADLPARFLKELEDEKKQADVPRKQGLYARLSKWGVNNDG